MASNRLINLTVLCALIAGTTAMDTYAMATLNGGNSVPAVNTPTTGSFMMGNAVGDKIDWTLDVKDITDMTMAHIHYGNSTSSGPVVVGLVPVPDPKAMNASMAPTMLTTPVSGDQTFTSTFGPADFMGDLKGMTMDKFLQALTSNNLYVNVHTVANPGGVIRGQIAVGAAPGPAASSGVSATAFSGAVVATTAAAFALIV